MIAVFKRDDPHDLLDIYEEEFGDITHSVQMEGQSSVQALLFSSQNCAATLGLSGEMRNEFIPVSCELIIDYIPPPAGESSAELLLLLVGGIYSGRLPFPSRGSFISFRDFGEVNRGNFSGLYFTNPVYRTEKFMKEVGCIGVVIISVVLISDRELRILEEQGWPALEEEWDLQGSDTRDVRR